MIKSLMVKTYEEENPTTNVVVCDEVDITQLTLEWVVDDKVSGKNDGYEEANRIITERFGENTRIHTVRLGPKSVSATKVDSKVSQWIVNITKAIAEHECNNLTVVLDTLTLMIDAGCEVPSEIDGDINCHYCAACLSSNEDHDIDCTYKKSRALVFKVLGNNTKTGETDNDQKTTKGSE